MLILMDEDYEPIEIWEAERDTITEASAETSAKRAKRGAMSVAKFKAISQLVWSGEQPPE